MSCTRYELAPALTSAAAKVMVQRSADLTFCETFSAVDQSDRAHQDATEAKTTLPRLFCPYCGLHRVRVFKRANALRGCDFFAFQCGKRQIAAGRRHTVNQDGAGTTVTVATTHANALEAKIVSKCKNRKGIGWKMARDLGLIDH